MLVAGVMVSLFAISYSLALGRPVPPDVPAGLVSGDSRPVALAADLERVTDQGLSFRRLASPSAAERAIGKPEFRSS